MPPIRLRPNRSNLKGLSFWSILPAITLWVGIAGPGGMDWTDRVAPLLAGLAGAAVMTSLWVKQLTYRLTADRERIDAGWAWGERKTVTLRQVAAIKQVDHSNAVRAMQRFGESSTHLHSNHSPVPSNPYLHLQDAAGNDLLEFTADLEPMEDLARLRQAIAEARR